MNFDVHLGRWSALSGKHEKGKENRVEGNDEGQRERPAMGSHESGAAQISENAADEGIKFRVQGSKSE